MLTEEVVELDAQVAAGRDEAATAAATTALRTRIATTATVIERVKRIGVLPCRLLVRI
jgi:hypothetical protein